MTRLPLDQNEHVYDQELNVNYKRVFVDLMRRSTRLESGRAFSKWQITPVEINAIAAYKNIIATGEHQNLSTSSHVSTSSSSNYYFSLMNLNNLTLVNDDELKCDTLINQSMPNKFIH